MLGLHYVPGGYSGHACPKRSAPWDFSPLLIFVKVLLRFLTFSHGLSRYAGRAVKGRRWSTPGGSKSRYGSARSAPDLLRMSVRCLPGRHGVMGVPRVSHVLMKDWDVFHVLSRLSANETWTPDSFGVRLNISCLLINLKENFGG